MIHFQLDFTTGTLAGEKPLEVFENLSPAELKKVYKKIKNPSQRLVGYLSYEWGAALEGIEPACANDALDLPQSWFGLYEIETIKNAGPVRFGTHPPTRIRSEGIRPKPATRIFQSSFSKKKYFQAIKKILDYLRAGDCYQVNLSQRFETATQETAWEIYQRLKTISPAPYSAFLDCGPFQILSASPELFLEARADGTLITKPIKGTRPRGKMAEEDAKLKEELQTSPKDKAELLMITDLERNDLGKICSPGSVKVTQLQNIETFAQLHHLVSTIEGQRRADKDIIDCLIALMPGGSITGAPKIRAMEIIKELEPVNRGVYTGAIGWIGADNTACFNIAIRTLVIQNQKNYFSAGGGIVIDSDPEKEYEETLTKASGIMKALTRGF